MDIWKENLRYHSLHPPIPPVHEVSHHRVLAQHAVKHALGKGRILFCKVFDQASELCVDARPCKGVLEIRKTYDRALDEAYTDERGVNMRSFIEATAGGPYERIPWTLYNTIGAVYPTWTREQRDLALSQILGILDGRNYAEVNGAYGTGHTTGIREPLLLADIKVARGIYWPGLEEQMSLLNKFLTFEEFSEEILDLNGFDRSKVTSDFLLAYTLLRKPEWNDAYARFAKTFTPRFLERTITGIAAMNFFRGDPAIDEERLKRMHELLPASIIPDLERAREKRDWVDYRKFP